MIDTPPLIPCSIINIRSESDNNSELILVTFSDASQDNPGKV